MVQTFTHKDLTWVDIESPTQDEVRDLMRTYNLDPLVADELLLPTLKPRVDVYDTYIYLILHFPAFRHTHNGSTDQEVDFIIGKNFIITTRYDTVDPLHKFSKVFEVNSVLDKSDIGDHAGYLFFYMIRKLYKALEHELEYINDALELIEEEIFEEGNSKGMVFALSNVGRDLLNLKQALNPHREILESFDEAARGFFGDSYRYHSRSVFGEYYRIRNQIDIHASTLAELRQTNDSLLYSRQNEVMKILTIMAFTTFPLTLISSIFGMNATTLPLVGTKGDFWMIIGIMVTLTLVFFIFFKRNKWL